MNPDVVGMPNSALGGDPESVLQFLSHHRQGSRRRQERNRRRRRRVRTVGLLLGIGTALALVGMNVLIWGNFAHLRFVTRTPAGAVNASESTPPTSTHRASLHPAPLLLAGETTPQPPKKAARRRPVSVRLTAARGESWVQIRTGSAHGRVLFEGVVRRGRSVRIAGRRLWGRFGALGNLDVIVNGRRIQPGLTGTLDTIISRSAIRAAPPRALAG